VSLTYTFGALLNKIQIISNIFQSYNRSEIKCCAP